MKITKILSAVALVMCFANAGYFDDIKTDSKIFHKHLQYFEDNKKILEAKEDSYSMRWAGYALWNERYPNAIKELAAADDADGFSALIEVMRRFNVTDLGISSLSLKPIIDNNAVKCLEILKNKMNIPLKEAEISLDKYGEEKTSALKYAQKKGAKKEIVNLLAK